MGYRLLCLRKTDECSTDEEEDIRHVSEWVGDGAGYSSDEEIQDDDAPNYYPYQEFFPQLEILKDNYNVILEEMLAVQQIATWPFWPEKHYAEGDSEWRVFPFCYTFPAYDATKTTWVGPTCSMCPRTAALLKSLPGIRTALFSKLGPNTTLTAHRGWADLANHVLRVHFPLVVPTLPTGAPCCAMVVGGETTYHAEREFIVFDDSKLHYAFNHHPDKTRHVLIIDFYRPDELPRGRARGGHSDELDEKRAHVGHVGVDVGGESEVGQRAPDQAAGEDEEEQRHLARLLLRGGGDARQPAEAEVLHHEHAAVVGLQLVDLLLEDGDPEVLAHELDHVQRLQHARPVAGRALGEEGHLHVTGAHHGGVRHVVPTVKMATPRHGFARHDKEAKIMLKMAQVAPIPSWMRDAM
ncbi:hypothetical protein ON010_g15946 [Phytophthora cinnamomi]|nr:hypothetical protein ON010_g15946 [Phytophthora cinnamomi]